MTGNQESFANLVASGLNQTEAYRQAGYAWETMLPATVTEEASKLACRPNVSTRIAEIKQAVSQELQAEAVYTRASLARMTAKAYELAMASKQPSAANGSVKLIAELTGLLEPQQAASVQITKVTVVLSNQGPTMPGNTVDSTGEVIQSADEEE